MAKKKKTVNPEKYHFDTTPFKHLKGVVVSGLDHSPQQGAEKVAAVESPQDVFGSFADEMEMLGVKQLNQTDETEGAESRRSMAADPVVDDGEGQGDKELFLAAIEGLTVSFEDDFIEEKPRLGSTSRRTKQIKQGKLIPDASLDLHGFQCVEALRKLNHFLQNGQHHGWQTLLVITGKGLHSDAGEPALRNEIERFLSAEGKKQVTEWSRAPRQYGGDGALILFLAKQ